MAQLPSTFKLSPEEQAQHQRTQQLPPTLPAGGATRPPRREDYESEGSFQDARRAQRFEPAPQRQQFFDQPQAQDAPAPITGKPWVSGPEYERAAARRIAYDPANDTFPEDCTLTTEQRGFLGMQSQFVGFMDTPTKVMEHWQQWDEFNARAAEAEQNDKEARKAAEREAKRQADAVAREKRRIEAEAKRAESIAKHARIEAARVEWKLAVEQRRQAVAQWDEFVRQKHEAFSAAKNS